VTPLERTLVRVESIESTESIEGYRLVRSARLHGTPVGISWTVRMPAGRRYVVFDLRIANDGTEPIRLDQDRGDTHDGIQLATQFGLDSSLSSVDGDVRFTLQRTGVHSFADQPRWKTFPNTRRISVFDDKGGATLTYLRGSSAPKMVVVHGGGLSFLVNELVVEPGDAVDYRFGVFVHRRGEQPEGEQFRQAADRINQWERDHLQL